MIKKEKNIFLNFNFVGVKDNYNILEWDEQNGGVYVWVDI